MKEKKRQREDGKRICVRTLDPGSVFGNCVDLVPVDGTVLLAEEVPSHLAILPEGTHIGESIPEVARMLENVHQGQISIVD